MLRNKPVEVVPVLAQNNASISFLELTKGLSEENDDQISLPIKWANPVTYVPSNYPETDALQIISDLGARLALAEDNAVVFLITSESLPQIIQMSGLNRELRQRRWFAKGMIIS